MAAPIYVSPEAQRMMARSKPAQIHRYDVKVNTRDAARCCTHDDVTVGTAKGVSQPKKSSPDGNGVHHHYVTVNVPARLGQYESTGSPDEGGATQEGVKPGNAAKGIEETGTGRKGGADNPFVPRLCSQFAIIALAAGQDFRSERQLTSGVISAIRAADRHVLLRLSGDITTNVNVALRKVLDNLDLALYTIAEIYEYREPSQVGVRQVRSPV